MKISIAALAAVAALSLATITSHAQEADNGAAVARTVAASASPSGCFGHVVRVSTYAFPNPSYVYFRTSALNNDYFYGTTTDPRLLSAAHNALTGGPAGVKVVGDLVGFSSPCPSGGGSVGNLQMIRVNP